MTKKIRQNLLTLQGFYLFVFFGLGGISTLLSVYLSEVEGLNGYQIGTIMSINPIIMIFFQPVWGLVSDKTNAPIKVLSITTFLAGLFGLGFLAFHGYYWFLLIATLVAIFQSAIIPLSDNLSMKYSTSVGYNYGNIRLYGSLGFGIAVFILGRISDSHPASIFYFFFFSLTLAAIIGTKFPKERTSGPRNLLTGFKEILLLRKFLLFLVITFLILGPNLANNTYFGLFIGASGGTYTGIGIAFLIAVLSEVPFMWISGLLIKKFGLLSVVMIAGAVAVVRWFFYFTEPTLPLVYGTAVMQGASIGLFLPAGLQYVRDIIPSHIGATGVTIYSAIGNGLGNWFCTFIGGIFLEEISIFAVYLFFAFLSIIGLLLNFALMKGERKSGIIHEAR